MTSFSIGPGAQRDSCLHVVPYHWRRRPVATSRLRFCTHQTASTLYEASGGCHTAPEDSSPLSDAFAAVQPSRLLIRHRQIVRRHHPLTALSSVHPNHLEWSFEFPTGMDPQQLQVRILQGSILQVGTTTNWNSQLYALDVESLDVAQTRAEWKGYNGTLKVTIPRIKHNVILREIPMIYDDDDVDDDDEVAQLSSCLVIDDVVVTRVDVPLGVSDLTVTYYKGRILVRGKNLSHPVRSLTAVDPQMVQIERLRAILSSGILQVFGPRRQKGTADQCTHIVTTCDTKIGDGFICEEDVCKTNEILAPSDTNGVQLGSTIDVKTSSSISGRQLSFDRDDGCDHLDESDDDDDDDDDDFVQTVNEAEAPADQAVAAGTSSQQEVFRIQRNDQVTAPLSSLLTGSDGDDDPMNYSDDDIVMVKNVNRQWPYAEQHLLDDNEVSSMFEEY